MALPTAVQKVIELLTRTYGVTSEFGTSRLLQFGGKIACSINYSKLLRGDKFFFGLAQRVTDASYRYPKTELGEFVILICGTPDLTLVLPRKTILSMMRGVGTGKLDVFRERGEYILQTTGHPKLTVTKYLNAFPATSGRQDTDVQQTIATSKIQKDRLHVATQGALVMLGRAEGCKVWVPPADRNLSFEETEFVDITTEKLPNFGFDEYSRRVIQNIDVL
jgi:hypothetical protein